MLKQKCPFLYTYLWITEMLNSLRNYVKLQYLNYSTLLREDFTQTPYKGSYVNIIQIASLTII